MNDPIERLRHAVPHEQGDFGHIWHKTQAGVMAGARPDRQLGGRATKVAGVLVAVAVVATVTVVGLRASHWSLGGSGFAGTPSPSGTAATIEIVTETDYLDDPIPLERIIERPVLKGVAPEVAEAFSTIFDSHLRYWTNWTMDNNSDDPRTGNVRLGCDPKTLGNGDGFRLKVTTTAEVYRGLATATILWDPNFGCPEGAHQAASITMDIASGELVPVGIAADFPSGAFASALGNAAAMQCPAASSDSFLGNFPLIEAWMPTEEGLVLTWAQSSVFRPDQCEEPTDIVIVVPWDLLDGQGSWTVQPGCPEWAVLPDGLSQGVCGPVPLPSVVLPSIRVSPEDSGPTPMFVTPSGNIYCDIHPEQVWCGEYLSDFAPEPDDGSQSHENDRTQVLLSGQESRTSFGSEFQPTARTALDMGQSVPTLEYGQTVVEGNFACTSQEIGLSCWDMRSKSGFWLSKENYSVWNWRGPEANETSLPFDLSGENNPLYEYVIVDSIEFDTGSGQYVVSGRGARQTGTWESGAMKLEEGDLASVEMQPEDMVINCGGDHVTMEQLYNDDYLVDDSIFDYYQVVYSKHGNAFIVNE